MSEDQFTDEEDAEWSSKFKDSRYVKTLVFEMGQESSDEDDPDDEEKTDRQILVGICSMGKKSKSRPMQEILERLERFHYIKAVIFDEWMIINQPVNLWPIVDCLISFHSKGFPLDKAVSYAELRQPMVINDLYMQYHLQNRRKVHEILTEAQVEQPLYAVIDRGVDAPSRSKLIESEDHLEVNNLVFHKPFVEKPLSAEDHNVYIYFPSSAGGGSQRLFRKIGNKSSVYSPVSNIRKLGSFIYEEFMPTDGTDVKVYTVGPDYAHAEARKSPALDGKVERGQDGKEVRYPVILSAKEKMIARTVCLSFKQSVCGFDLLRANGKSYVCDVNGFSFVKTSKKYYDDCAKILGSMILRQLAPTRHIPFDLNVLQAEDLPIVPTTSGTMMELRCVVAVIRHGDRTPKQKMKMEVRHQKFFDLFEKYGGYTVGELKLKKPKQLQEILDISRFLLHEIKTKIAPELEEKKSKLEQLKSVLEMYGHFSGINRKVQLKFQPEGAPKKSDEDDNYSGPFNKYRPYLLHKSSQLPSLVLILKWGGELTPMGKQQGEELGKAFRLLYPGGVGESGIAPGLGLLRLHSTFRHDLKIYASDEGRVQMTAAAFTKGLLALEGELPPILAQMVKSANMNGLLDNDTNESPKCQRIVKERLQEFLNQDRQLTEEDMKSICPTKAKSMMAALKIMNNPRRLCENIHKISSRLLKRVQELKALNTRKADLKLYNNESWELMARRWGKLVKDFKMKNDEFDISKIPDIYDCIKYDLLHNQASLQFDEAEELHFLSKIMADLVIPQEYGMTVSEKLLIAQCICTPLLRKILADLDISQHEEETTRLDTRYSKGVATPHRHVKTRLYFTSESHIHSLLNMIHYGGLGNEAQDEQWARAMDYVSQIPELSYMTQIVIMLYENPAKPEDSDERFHVEVHFSPGAQSPHEFIPKNTNSLGYRSQLDEQAKERDTPQKTSSIPQVLTAPGSLRDEVPGTSLEAETLEPDTADSLLTPVPDSVQSSSSSDMAQIPTWLEDGGMDADFFHQHVAYTCAADSLGSLVHLASMGADCKPGGKSQHLGKCVTFAETVKKPSSTLQEVGIPEEGCELSPSGSDSSVSKALDMPRARHHSGSALQRKKDVNADDNSGRPSSLDSDKDEQILKEHPLEKGNRSRSLGEDVHLTPGEDTHIHQPSLNDFLSIYADQERLGPRFISTKVITGSSSAPNLLEDDLKGNMGKGLDGWNVANVRPLETLHNALTLKHMEKFFIKLTTSTISQTPSSSPTQGSSTPIISQYQFLGRPQSAKPADIAEKLHELQMTSKKSSADQS